MDKNALTAFISIAEHQSFSIAAEALFLTQPAVSKRIKNLEQKLNSKLIDRKGKKITLTQAGTALLPRAQKILSDMDECQQAISDLSGRTMGSLSLATSHHIGLHRLPPVLQSFVKQHPKVELDLHFMDSEQACHAVDKGDMEIAVVTLPTKKWAHLNTKIVWTDRLVISCNQQHPLASITKPQLEDLVKYPCILPSKGTFTRNIIESKLLPKNLSLMIGMETNYLETIKMLVSVGLGWSILPANLIEGQKEFKCININEFEAIRDLGVVTHNQRTLSNPSLALIKTLNEQIS